MLLLQHLLLLLFVLATIISWFSPDLLALLIPGVGAYVLPGLLGVALLIVLMARVQSLTGHVNYVFEELEVSQKQQHTMLTRFETVAAQTARLSEEVQQMRLTMAHSELLLPGRLLLLQRRYEEAGKVFQDIIAHHPTNREARWLLGETLFVAKRHIEALPHLLAGLVETDVHRLTLVAQCEQALGRYAEAEIHLLRLIEIRGEPYQDDLVTLGTIQSELDPARARETLTQVLALNPYNSVARYQLIELETRAGVYERAIALATEGLTRNSADVGCCVSRAEAYFRRGQLEDEVHILDDLATAQAKNRKDYNIYRLRGALHQRRASRMHDPAKSQQALHTAIAAYEDGLANVPPKFHAHLLAAESRVLLQLKRFDDAVTRAQRAVDHFPGHVSNHLALAFARLACRQWKAAAQAADRGMQWAGWGGRVWLTAIGLFANALVGGEPTALRQKCAALAADLKADDKRFALSESWSVVRDVLQKAAGSATDSRGTLVSDTIALLERTMTPEQYQRRWAEAEDLDGHGAA
jgi:tetratricopeptide (TPR) repeat protein